MAHAVQLCVRVRSPYEHSITADLRPSRRPPPEGYSTTWLGTPFRTPGGSPPIRPAGCRAEPDRRGRVGVAHATGICALVRNISQAWGSNPPTGPRSEGWGTPPRRAASRAESRPRATAKLSYNAAHKAILPRPRCPRPRWRPRSDTGIIQSSPKRIILKIQRTKNQTAMAKIPNTAVAKKSDQ